MSGAEHRYQVFREGVVAVGQISDVIEVIIQFPEVISGFLEDLPAAPGAKREDGSASCKDGNRFVEQPLHADDRSGERFRGVLGDVTDDLALRTDNADIGVLAVSGDVEPGLLKVGLGNVSSVEKDMEVGVPSVGFNGVGNLEEGGPTVNAVSPEALLTEATEATVEAVYEVFEGLMGVADGQRKESMFAFGYEAVEVGLDGGTAVGAAGNAEAIVAVLRNDFEPLLVFAMPQDEVIGPTLTEGGFPGVRNRRPGQNTVNAFAVASPTLVAKSMIHVSSGVAPVIG